MMGLAGESRIGAVRTGWDRPGSAVVDTGRDGTKGKSQA